MIRLIPFKQLADECLVLVELRVFGDGVGVGDLLRLKLVQLGADDFEIG